VADMLHSSRDYLLRQLVKLSVVFFWGPPHVCTAQFPLSAYYPDFSLTGLRIQRGKRDHPKMSLCSDCGVYHDSFQRLLFSLSPSGSDSCSIH